MKINPVGWAEIYVDDMERAKKFYESVFEGKLQKLNVPEPEMWAFPSDMEHYGAGGALVKIEGFPSGKNSVIVYFSCDDCAIESGRVAASGGTVQKAKYSIGQYGFISLVADTEGNMFGLHSLK
jgi:predicted enzyme related to lactoylglutathione lyase